MLFFYLGSINDSIIEKHLRESQKERNENGDARAYDIMKARLEEWKKIKIKLAVTGNAGVGKSSFINAIRG